jgi:hypothetical protein
MAAWMVVNRMEVLMVVFLTEANPTLESMGVLQPTGAWTVAIPMVALL